MPRIPADTLTDFSTRLLAQGGLGGDESALVATSLAFQNQPAAAVKDTALPGNLRVAVLDQNGGVLTSG